MEEQEKYELMEAIGLSDASDKLTYEDVAEIAAEVIGFMGSNGYIEEPEQTTFNPHAFYNPRPKAITTYETAREEYRKEKEKEKEEEELKRMEQTSQMNAQISELIADNDRLDKEIKRVLNKVEGIESNQPDNNFDVYRVYTKKGRQYD